LLFFAQKSLGASSANGATALLHVIAVCESSLANSPINSQFPFASSKNQLLRGGPRFSQSKTYASTRGLTGSIKSWARRRDLAYLDAARLGLGQARVQMQPSELRLPKSRRDNSRLHLRVETKE